LSIRCNPSNKADQRVQQIERDIPQGASGIHTFIVNQDGVIYEKDLGNPATSASTTVARYDPDRSWTRVE
jgi:hypothetical protein